MGTDQHNPNAPLGRAGLSQPHSYFRRLAGHNASNRKKNGRWEETLAINSSAAIKNSVTIYRRSIE
jgi:hypothetical protein